MLKIVIKTDLDFTPKGKRNARIVETSSRLGSGRQLRWYVSGKIYRKLSITHENLDLTNKWLAA